MTFEEWFDSSDYIKNHSILSEYGEVCSMLEHAWNAAIVAAQQQLSKDQYYIAVFDNDYEETCPESKLQGLLTEPPL